MASGKASPRQKMINMMYLVLTALLAMNVSAEVLESFQQLADSLRISAENYSQKNVQSARDIIHTIESDPANKKSLPLVPLIKHVGNYTDSTIAQIDTMRNKLYSEDIGGGRVEGLFFHILNKSETEKNLRFWMMAEDGSGDETSNEGRGAGKARELRDLLDTYVAWANNIWATQMTVKDSATGRMIPGDPKHFTSIVQSPADIFPADNPDFAEKRNRTWEQFNFVGTPVVANLALLEKLKNDVTVIEAELLQMLRSKIDNIVFKIDSLIAVSAPESQFVIAGMQFKTRLYVTVSSTQMKPQFGGGVRVLEGGQVGELSIGASGAVIPQGRNEGQQAYQTTITVPKADGSTQVLPVRGTFTVRRPEITVESDAVQILYAQCANVLKIDCPALGPLYNPVYTPRGGEAKKNPQDPKKVMLIPAGGPFELVVSTNTNGQILELGRLRYRVIPPPKPTLAFASAGQPLTSGANIRAGGTVAVSLSSEPNFARALPNDARYGLTTILVQLKRGLAPPQTLRTIQCGGPQCQIPLAAMLTNARAGEQVILEVNGMFRRNFANNNINITDEFPARERIISLTVQP